MNNYKKKEPQSWGSLVLEYRTKDYFKPDTDLYIVNVTEPYKDVTGIDAIDKITEYCLEFPRVFQIIDSSAASKPTFTFPNQIGSIESSYGKFPGIGELANTLPGVTKMRFMKDRETGHKPGDLYMDMYGWALLYVGHEKKWMYCNPKLVKALKDAVNLNRKLVFVGGSLETSMKEIVLLANTLGAQVMVNFDLSYS
jgi:hypothetical protein